MLAAGAIHQLQSAVIRELWPRFFPAAKLLYLGDIAGKDRHVDREPADQLRKLFDHLEEYPDLAFFRLEDPQWLIVVEGLTGHGPLSQQRRGELQLALETCELPRVLVAAFTSRQDVKPHLDAIGWDTAVWVADEPGHMIHLNGSTLLAPVPRAETHG